MYSRARLQRSHLGKTFLQTSERQVAEDKINRQQLSELKLWKAFVKILLKGVLIFVGNISQARDCISAPCDKTLHVNLISDANPGPDFNPVNNTS